MDASGTGNGIQVRSQRDIEFKKVPPFQRLDGA
jgi:hypothetical protein